MLLEKGPSPLSSIDGINGSSTEMQLTKNLVQIKWKRVSFGWFMGFAFWACVQRPVERGETEQEIPEKNNKQKKKVGNQVYTKYERVLFFSVGTLWRQIGRKLWKRFFIWNKKKKGRNCRSLALVAFESFIANKINWRATINLASRVDKDGRLTEQFYGTKKGAGRFGCVFQQSIWEWLNG